MFSKNSFNRSIIISFSVLFVLLLTGCAAEREEEILIENKSYNPAELKVRSNTEVTWINNDTIPHSVTSGIPGAINFDSGEIQPGSSFSFIFKDYGPYEYYCEIHSANEMKGIVTVVKK